MKSKDIRSQFLQFFKDRGHEVVPSSSLVPGNDPTLLFTNAGMVQFKDVFLGVDKRPYKRATTSQRCVRAGGKHNDLENVGYTARHHTFFEMLGNFSFGDYFKRDAIVYCWELLTEVYGLPPDKLWVTVFEDDDEAEEIWFKDIGIDKKRFSRCGVKDNFWSMGDTGPCGPCSEVFYDHGAEIPGGPPGSPDEDGDRYIELWNLVFMQFNRDASGQLTPLPKPSVDTGMGLERIAAVLQGVHSNYEIDLFENLVKASAEVTHVTDLDNKSLQVIADHIRSCAFMIADGVMPEKDGRGYVLRRIIRRAIRHGHRLGVKEPFFHLLVSALETEMGDAYPILTERQAFIERALLQEEERFAETLDKGMGLLEQAIRELEGDIIPGETLFKLYDTYGFPVDLTADIAREQELQVDMDGFERAMKTQRETSQDASAFVSASLQGLDVDCKTEFVGYQHLEQDSEVIGIYVDGTPVEVLQPEDKGIVVLGETPFYAEGGGQVGDQGTFTAGGVRFEVGDTKRQANASVHVGVLTDGEIRVGDKLSAHVDGDRRLSIARNHSATHLLHAALRQVLGNDVTQKGSLVAPDRLRFDFSHMEPVADAELRAIETLVNQWVLQNDEAKIELMPLADAIETGAMALFGEKYDDPVRVLSIGDYSTELCGGTHVRRSGDVGLFKITSETGVSAGVRRIEALTGHVALQWLQDTESQLDDVASMVKSDRVGLVDKVSQLVARQRDLEKDLERLTARLASTQGDDLASQAVDVSGLKVLAAKIDGVDPKSLRNTVDQLKSKLGSAAVVLATVKDDKVSLVAGVTKDYTDRLQAGPLANFVANQVGGGGGGRPDMAQAGGTDPSRIDQAIKSVPNWVKEQLAS